MARALGSVARTLGSLAWALCLADLLARWARWLAGLLACWLVGLPARWLPGLLGLAMGPKAERTGSVEGKMAGLGPYYQVNKIARKQQSIKESTYLKAMEPSTLQTTLCSLVPHKGAGGFMYSAVVS